MPIVGAIIVPHPPLIIPTVGRGQEQQVQATIDAYRAGTLGERDPSLDHGTFLPLYFLQEAGVRCPILRIGLSGFSPLQHYQLGQCVAKAVDKLGRKAVFIASGDLLFGECHTDTDLPTGLVLLNDKRIS